jgi:hypothetical protein
MTDRTMHSKRKLIKTVYAAFNHRDIDAVFAHMQPDVDWPNGLEGGREHGKNQVRAYWTRQWAIINPHVDPLRVEDDTFGNTVVDVHQVVRDLSGNVILDQMVQHVYCIRYGLIERMDIRTLQKQAD